MVQRIRKATKRQPECKVLRQCRLVEPLSPGWGFIVLEITVGRDKATYTVSKERSELGGVAAHYTKQGEVEVHEDGSGHHDTLLDGENSLCDCRGFAAYGYCRHLWSLEICVRRGWLH
jgi:hypothetical protein